MLRERERELADVGAGNVHVGHRIYTLRRAGVFFVETGTKICKNILTGIGIPWYALNPS